MLRNLFILVTAVHGLIHMMGFAKAFGYGNMKQLTVRISKPAGIIWLIATLLFIITVILLLLNKTGWYIIAIPAVILSQVLLVLSWKDAKFGTIVNIIILVVAISDYAQYRLNHSIENISGTKISGASITGKTSITKEKI
jgi:hypothetical protein